MAMSENVNLAWRMFKNLGYSDVATSALLGNAMTESYPDLRPTVVNEDDADSQGSSSFGIFQWRDSKKEGAGGWDSPRIQWLKTYAQEKNLDPNDIRTQVLFTDWELRNKFRSTYDKLRTSNNLNDATLLVDSDYLFSRKTSKNTKSRLNNANQVLLNFKGSTGNMDVKNEDEKFNEKKIKEYENFIDKNQIYKNMSNSGDDMENKDNSTFIGKFKNYVSNPDNFGDMMGRLGTLANRLTLDPDPQYASRMNEGRLLQQQMEKQNRTADVLDSMGYPEIAQMMRNGEITGANALSFIKGDKASSNKIKEFLEAKKLGLIGEDVSWEDYLLVKSGVVPEDEVTKALIKSDVARYEKFMEEAGNTTKQLDMLNELATLNVGKGDIQGGFAELKSGFYNVMAGFGLLSPEKQTMLANAQTFESFANQLVLDLMGGSLGAGFSDADRKFVISMAPMLGNTQKANEMVMEKMRAIILRREEVAQLMRAYFRDNNSLQGFQAFVNEKYGYTKTGKHQDGSNSLFGGKDKYIIKASINS